MSAFILERRTAARVCKQATLLCSIISISTVTTAFGQARELRPLEEVIVTAQKRAESLQDVPVPVTAISAETLASANLLRLKDYYSKVPGLALVQTGDTGQPIIAIRGLVTGGQSNSTVGYVIDDVPYGSTINPGTLPYAPDVDPSDLARIEVLRGPQGTLYGASSLGGLLKFVTVDPSTEELSGRLQTGTTSVEDGDDLGYSVRGSVNVPLGESLAVRASAFTREEPGYVDDVVTGQQDVNSTSARGGRVSALWRPSDSFSLRVNALTQKIERDGSDDINIALGTGRQHAELRGTGTYNRTTEAYSATMTAKLGSAEVVSITGYNVDDIQILDSVPSFNFLAVKYFGVGSTVVDLPIETEKFTQELRASMPLGERVQWLVGAFYTEEEFAINPYTALAADSTTASIAGTLLTIRQPVSYEEYAAFTTATVQLTRRFDVQLGGRYSENRQAFATERTGPGAVDFYGSNPSFVPGVRGTDSSFTYLVTPRFRFSPDLMAYARLASGYRPGGANANCTGIIPCQYEADTTQNYDLGIKGSVFDGALSFDTSLYYIDWRDIQVPLSQAGLPFTDNVGKAKSQGVELALKSRPAQGLSVSGWAAWSDARLERPLPTNSGVQGVAGDKLPYSSRWSGSLSLDQEFPLWGSVTGMVGASVSYVGERRGQFKRVGLVRGTFPEYTQVDLSGSIYLSTWTISAFVNNVADKRGVLRDGADFNNINLVTHIQPRTLGLQLQYQF